MGNKHFTTSSSLRRSSRRGGFVLIAVLLVVSLLTTLIVASLVMAQTEELAQYNASRDEVARQNAIFGLNQALNQLQTAAGPDRRVTARADILNAANSGNNFGYGSTQPATDSGQTFWTGVWKNTSNDFSGCGGNGETSLNPDPAPIQNPGPGGSFFYYDYFADGKQNSTAASVALSPGAAPSRNQLYNNSNVSWLISWPYDTLKTAPDPTRTLAAQMPSLVLPTVNGNVTFLPSPTTSATSPYATLASKLNSTTTANSSLTTSKTSISAPKVPILERKAGSNITVAVGTYAYWVSDEGIKAKTDIPDPYLGSSSIPAAQAHFQVAQSTPANQGMALEYVSNSATFPNENSAVDLRTNPVIAPTLASMAFADAGLTWTDFQTNPNNYSPDFTVSSYGVIADNFNGGLKQDLTAALEDTAIYQNQFGDLPGNESVRKVYSIDNILQSNVTTLHPVTDVANIAWTANGKGIIFDGLRWDSLFYYYNIYHALMPSPVSTAGTSTLVGIGSQFSKECTGTTPNVTPRIYDEVNPTGDSKGGAGAIVMDGIIPQLGYWNYNFGIDVNCTGPDAGGYDYDFVVGTSPTVVFVNPFNVSTSMGTGVYEAITGDAGSVLSNSLPPTLEIEDTATNTIKWSQTVTFPATGGIDIDVDSVPYSAGEVRAYGLSNQWSANHPILAPQAFPLAAGAPTLPNNFMAFTTAGSASKPGNRLVPTNFTDTNYQQEELTTSPPINFQNPANYAFLVSGAHRFFSINQVMQRWGSNVWPNGSTGYMWTGSLNLPSMSLAGAQSAISTTPKISYLSTVAGNKAPDPGMQYVESIEDHLPGIAVNSFEPWTGATPFPNAGFPSLAAGGAVFNPFCRALNSYMRDYTNSGEISNTMFTSSSDLNLSPNAANGNVYSSTYLPDSVGSQNPLNQKRAVIYDVPRQPLMSVGQFKNMFCNYETLNSEHYTITFGYLGFSVYPVGDSYNAGIPYSDAFVVAFDVNGNNSTNTANTSGEYGMPYHLVLQDDNFLANSSLFDGYYFSTVPPAAVKDYGNWQITSTVNQAYVDANMPLPDSRLVYYKRPQSTPAGDPPSTGSTSPNISDLQLPNAANANLRKPAANLLINGAFNVNSTSVPAWISLLTSTSASGSDQLSLFSSQGNTTSTSVTSHNFSFSTTSPNSSEVPFLNFSLASGPLSWSGGADTQMPWFGLVDLSGKTVSALAARIVAQVQARGPFLTLGDFLNHRLAITETPLSSSGALQNAIDGAAINNTVGGNVGLPVSSSTNASVTSGLAYYNDAGKGPSVPPGFVAPVFPDNPPQTGVGVPGTILQGDLVKVLAPVIAARSDTFTIRFYGQSMSPTGVTEAEAYGEAIVQRLPEYEYSTENGITDSAGRSNYAYDNPSQTTINTESATVSVDGLTPENSQFGRRFKVISIRWLNKNEI